MDRSREEIINEGFAKYKEELIDINSVKTFINYDWSLLKDAFEAGADFQMVANPQIFLIKKP